LPPSFQLEQEVVVARGGMVMIMAPPISIWRVLRIMTFGDQGRLVMRIGRSGKGGDEEGMEMELRGEETAMIVMVITIVMIRWNLIWNRIWNGILMITNDRIVATIMIQNRVIMIEIHHHRHPQTWSHRSHYHHKQQHQYQ